MDDKHLTNWTQADDRMVERAIRGGATRRDLLRLLAVGGMAAAAGGSVLTRASATVAATPTSGGSLTAAGWSASTADTLDPAKASLSTDYVRICAFYNRLTFMDQFGKIQMELADSIESTDAKTWTIKLRKGVTFHSGKTLTSADVVYSLKRHLDPAVGSKVHAIAKQMSSFATPDANTIEVGLSAANADLPTILAIHHFMIVADGTTDFSKGDGTGAFICQEFTPGVRSIGIKNKNYWKSNQPYLDSFTFFGISDDTARVDALLAGNVQIAGSIDPRSIRLVKTQPGFDVSVTNSGNYTNLNMRLDMAPGDQMDFVTGVKYLLDRDQIKQAVLRDLAVIGNDQPVSPSDIYHNADLKPKPFDPDRAKFHFNKAGVMGQTIPFVCSDAATSSVDMAMVLQQAAADIGMTFNVQREPADGYWDEYWLKAPIEFGNINPRPTPDILFSLLYASDAPWNESQFKSPKFDSMLLEARGLLDQAKRKEIYGEMQVMIAEQAGTAIPAYLSDVDALSNKVQGMVPNPLGGLMGYAFAEYVWMA